MALFKSDSTKRYIKPLKSKPIKQSMVKYQNAKDLALQLDLENRTFAIIDGKFIFGDLIEAIIVERNWRVKNLIISTLSLDQNNIDSLAGLLKCNEVQNMGLIISDFFFSHTQRDLIPYIQQELDYKDRFQLAVCRSHCKIALIETDQHKLVIHGSANLNSSGNIEQIMIENNPDLFDFTFEYQNRILKKYGTIKNKINRKETWQLVSGSN